MSRRRKLNASGNGPQWLEYGNEALKPETVVVVGKGICRHCGEYIGRGVHFHERRCRDDNARHDD